MKDIFALDVSVANCTGAIRMVVAADSFPEAVVEADKTYTAWWEDYRKTPRGMATNANDRTRPGLVNVVLARRYRSDTRYSHVSRELAELINENRDPQASPGQIEDAQALYKGDETIRFDDDARVSRADGGGVWVQSWVLVENPA